MTKGWIGAAIAGLFVASAVVVMAVEAAETGPRVSVDFQKASMQDVANYIAVKAGVNIVVEKGVTGEVSVRLHDVPWFDALDIAAKQIGCLVAKGDNNIYMIATPHFSFTTKAEGVSLKQVISLLAQQSGQNIVVAPNVDAVVHFNLQDVPWQTALETVVKTAGPFTVVHDEGGVYRVVKSDSLSEQKETQVFKLKYIQPPSDYKPRIENEFAEKRSGQSGTSTGGAKQLRENFTLFRAIDQLVGAKGTVEYDFDSNAFIVTTTRPLLEQVASTIKLVDVEPGQVYVDVKFVTTGRTDLLNAGVKYPKGFMISGSGGSMVHRLPFELGSGSWEDDLSVTGSGPTPADVTAALGGDPPYTFGVLDFSNITPVLEFLKTDSKSEIIQAPVLTVADNKAATVFAGDEIHFAEEFSSSAQGGQLSKGIREASQNSPIKVGTQLMIMPHIIPDSNKVILQIIPTSQELTGTSSPTVSGFERFQVADSFIDLPRLSSRTVVTTMILEDGQTAVIGGLISVNKSDTRTKLPWFGDIPVIGWLFKNRTGNTTINNLYIFITIRIMRSSADVQKVFTEFDVPGAHMKPYKPGMPLEGMNLDEKDMPADKASSPAAEPTPAPSAAKDTVGSGWEESEQGVEKFDVKK